VLTTLPNGFGTLCRLTHMVLCGKLLAESAASSLEDAAALAAKISREPLSTRARPPDLPTWVTDHEGVRRHILRYDGTGSDEGVRANRHAADHHNACAQGGPLLHNSRQQLFTMTLDVRSRAQIVSKYHSGTEKDVVADMHALEDHDLILDRDTVSD